MPVISFSKVRGEDTANVVLTKFFERLEIEGNGAAISILEFILQVKNDSPLSLSKFDIIIPYVVSNVENVTETFTDPNLPDNQAYTNGLKLLDDKTKKYCIDGVEAVLASLSLPPEIETKEDYTKVRIKFKKMSIGEGIAFRLKFTIHNFAAIHNSLGAFELALYYTWVLENHIEKMQEYGVYGIEIDKRLCEMWVILPESMVYRMAIPEPQQIKLNHKYHLLSHDKFKSPRSALSWDLENTIFDLPGRALGDYISPGKGVRIYCEMTKPHVTQETFETRMNTALDTMEVLQGSANAAEKSLNFVAKHGKQSFIITLFFSAIAIIISAIALFKSL